MSGSLFDSDEPPPLAARLRPILRAWADRGVYFGTSSWKYEGWLGSIYPRSSPADAERPHSAEAPVRSVLSADEPEVGLVNQGSGIEGVAGGFGRHARGGQFPQLIVHEREQVRGGLSVSGGRGFKKAGHIRHSAECIGSRRREHWKPAAIPPSDPSPDDYHCGN